MKRWLWFGILVLGACQWFPWGRRDAKPVAEHLAENFYGVYVPWGDFLVGCRWEHYETPYGTMAGCRGIWKLDRGTGEMVPLRDTGRKIGAIEVSRNFQFLVYIRGKAWGWNPDSEPDSLVGLVLLDLHTGDTTVVQVNPVANLRISPYTPKIAYVLSLTQWGRGSVVWKVDFRNRTINEVMRCYEPNTGYIVFPGAKGDSVVCAKFGGRVNYVLNLEIWPTADQTFYLYNHEKQRRLSLDETFSDYISFRWSYWVHDQDTLIVATFGGNGPDWTPARWDLWWIPEIQDHLEEVPDTPGGGP